MRWTRYYTRPTPPTGQKPKTGIPRGQNVISTGKDGPKPMTLMEHAERQQADRMLIFCGKMEDLFNHGETAGTLGWYPAV